jgi:hypothetical protein
MYSLSYWLPYWRRSRSFDPWKEIQEISKPGTLLSAGPSLMNTPLALKFAASAGCRHLRPGGPARSCKSASVRRSLDTYSGRHGDFEAWAISMLTKLCWYTIYIFVILLPAFGAFIYVLRGEMNSGLRETYNNYYNSYLFLTHRIPLAMKHIDLIRPLSMIPSILSVDTLVLYAIAFIAHYAVPPCHWGKAERTRACRVSGTRALSPGLFAFQMLFQAKI